MSKAIIKRKEQGWEERTNQRIALEGGQLADVVVRDVSQLRVVLVLAQLAQHVLHECANCIV